MSEETLTIGQMIRTTSANTDNFLNQVADHIEKLENHIVALELQLSKLSEEQCKDENM